MKISEILKDGVSLSQVCQNVKEREYAINGGSLRKRGVCIMDKLPENAKKTLKQAEECLAGYTILPGCKDKRFIGNPPLWKENPFDDAEYTFQLSRVGHWEPMLQAYSMTGDERFAAKVISELEDWIEECPIPSMRDESGQLVPMRFDGSDSKWWRVLECGIRLFESWASLAKHLIDCELFNERILEKYLLSIHEQAERLYTISPLLWPKADHNHYLMENLGLLQTACRFPELKMSEAWREHAIRELCRCMESQVTENGGQIEGCPSYHNSCVYWFSLLVVYADKYGFSIPESYTKRFLSMFQYSIYTVRPNGWNVPWGDSSCSDADLVNAAIHYYHALGDCQYLKLCRHFCPNVNLMDMANDLLWQVKDVNQLIQDINQVGSECALPALPTVFWDRPMKQAFLRTGWDSDAISVMFACRTPIQNLHAHMDPNGFDLTAFGSPILVDPGRYNYKEGIDRYHFKCSQWHNMVTVNNRDAWEYIASWDYGEQKDGDILNICDASDLSYVVGRHENYEPVSLTRVLAIVEKSFVLILDIAEGICSDDTLQLNYHYDRPMQELLGEKSIVWCESALSNASISVSGTPTVTKIPAKVSDYSNAWRDSTIVQYGFGNCSAETRMAVASVIIPASAGQKPQAAQNVAVWHEQDTDWVSFEISGKAYKFSYVANQLSCS